MADVRRDNGPGIRGMRRRFVGLFIKSRMFSLAAVTSDGSKSKAVNSRGRNLTPS